MIDDMTTTLARAEKEFIDKVIRVADENEMDAAALLAAAGMSILHIVHREVFRGEQADDQGDAETSS